MTYLNHKNEKNGQNSSPEIIRRSVFHSRWMKAVSVLASLVVFVTVYMLILPAATITPDDAHQEDGFYLEKTAVAEEGDNLENTGWMTKPENSTEGNVSEITENPETLNQDYADRIMDWHDGRTYISISADRNARIPEDAYLTVTPLDPGTEAHHAYYRRALRAALQEKGEYSEEEINANVTRAMEWYETVLRGENAEDMKLFLGDIAQIYDIVIRDSTGKRIEPAAAVNVDIHFAEELTVPEDAEMKLVHFADDRQEYADYSNATPSEGRDVLKEAKHQEIGSDPVSLLFQKAFQYLGLEESSEIKAAGADVTGSGEEYPTATPSNLTSIMETGDFSEETDPDYIRKAEILSATELVSGTDVKNVRSISFTAESFSVYALIYIIEYGNQELISHAGEEGEDLSGVSFLSLECDTDTIAVSAEITDSGSIPADARLQVTPLTPDMDNYGAYMTALNRGYDENTYNSSNSLLYDISVITDGKEYEPENGRIELRLRFKENQLTEALGLSPEDTSALRVIHLPLASESEHSSAASSTGSAHQAPAPLSRAKLFRKRAEADLTAYDTPQSVDPSDILREDVSEALVDLEHGEEVCFTLTSLSVITVTGAATDVKVTGSLSGTDMKGLGYNLYAYLLANNDHNAYGAKLTFTEGNASATIPNVPVNTYRLYLVYAKNNRELQERWNYNNVLDSNTNNWVDIDGGYIFGYSADLPPDKTVTSEDNTISFELKVPEVWNSSVTASSIMDRALNYSVIADDVVYHVQSYSNFAAKNIHIQNANTGTYYGHRADGIETIPNIMVDITYDGLLLSTLEKDAEYYVQDKDKDKVDTSVDNDIVIVRNPDEISDRVEIMISNTLKQAEDLASKSMLTLPSMTSVDVSPYAENATIILDATAMSGEPNGFTIVKRPGQTVVFNINGQNALPPANIKVKLVNEYGQQIDADGNLSSRLYLAGEEMREAPASEGNIWNKIIWNFPDAPHVISKNCVGGVFLVPKGSFTVNDKGGGWIVARDGISITNQWYGFPGVDEPFVQKTVRKTFVGITEEEINPAYVLKLFTNTNESTSGTTQDQLITSFVLKPQNDPTLVNDPDGTNDQTGYLTKGIDAEGNIFYEWITPFMSIGSEHKVTEQNSVSIPSAGSTGVSPDLVEFTGPFSGWNEASQNYEWMIRHIEYAGEAELAGVFNVRSRSTDGYGEVKVTNHYNVVEEPHDLSITKLVTDPEQIEAAGQEYSFEISLKDRTGTDLTDRQISYTVNGGELRTASLSAGKVTILLKKDETARLIGLPYGAQYTILETNLPAKCTVEFSGDTISASDASGYLFRNRSVTATNTYADDPGVPVTAHKDLIGGTLIAGQFTFHLADQDGRLIQEAVNDANGNIAFGTLVFDHDGEYDYSLFEVADPGMKDILFDPAEYTVHIRVEGGRAREVSYTGENGTTTTTPMFRNTKIPTDSDTLAARKIFIDSEGKTVRLEGGEFTFTAVGSGQSEEDRITYTGTNDAQGMVVFKDGAGNAVDINDLTQPTVFTISETDGAYSGAIPAGETLRYDNSTHQANVTVDTRTVEIIPWTTKTVDMDNTDLTVTFTPKDTSGDQYYLKPLYDPDHSVIRSDGTVTFTVRIQKNLTGTDNAPNTFEFEYGIGFYYGMHTKTGMLKIKARGGNWGQAPVTIESVEADGVTLLPRTEIEKNVALSYPEGSYPVFINYLNKTDPVTMEFPFTKVWTDNATYTNLTAWKAGREITVRLTGTFVPDEQGAASGTREYVYKIMRNTEGSDPTFTFTQPAGEDMPQIRISETTVPEHHYRFEITGLPNQGALDGKDGHWNYVLKEDAVEGYTVEYGSWDSTAQKAVPDPTRAVTGIESGGYLLNARVTAELPSSGGCGTRIFYILGTILALGAGMLLVTRRRLLNEKKT